MRTARRLVALPAIFSIAWSGCVPNPREPGGPIAIPETVTQPGGNAARSAWGADGPEPPLHLAWTFSSTTDGYGGFGQPVIADGLIYVTSDKLYAVDATGREAWSFDPRIDRGFLSDPVIQGRDVVFGYRRGSEIGVQAVDRGSHERSWSWRASAPTRSTRGIWLDVEGDFLFVAADAVGPNLWLVERGGREVWWAEAERRPGSPVHTLPSAIGDGLVVIVTGRSLEARSMMDGSLAWRKDRGFHETPAISHGLVLTTTFNQWAAEYLNVFDLHSGRRLLRIPRVWRFAIAGQDVTTWRWGAQELGESPKPTHIEVFELPSLQRVSRMPVGPRKRFADQVLPVSEGVFTLESEESDHYLVRYGVGEGPTWEVLLPDHDPGIPGLDAYPNSITSTGGAILVTTGIGIMYAFAPGVGSATALARLDHERRFVGDRGVVGSQVG